MVFRDFNPINIKNKTCKSLQDKMTIFNPGEIMKAKIIKLLRLKKKKNPAAQNMVCSFRSFQCY